MQLPPLAGENKASGRLKTGVSLFGDGDNRARPPPESLIFGSESAVYPDSTARAPSSDQATLDGEDDEIDPLDAFMAGIEEKVDAERTAAPRPERSVPHIYEEDVQHFEEPRRVVSNDDDDAAYDEDDEYGATERRDEVPLLAELDHSTVVYAPFKRDFLRVHQDVLALTPHEVVTLREELGVQASGRKIPHPCISFAHMSLPDRVMDVLRARQYATPTAIQAQAIPIALQGRDIIGVAETGSGKTMAFVIPMIVHIGAATVPCRAGEGPVGLIVAPTRELAAQIFGECKSAVKTSQKLFPTGRKWRVLPVFGGMQMHEQRLALLKGCEIVVCTPGRLLDQLKRKALTLSRVTMVVLDEADKMLSMGFAPQVRSIMGQIRPDRQTLLFSATFKQQVQSLANGLLTDPIRITTGRVGASNRKVIQIVHVLQAEHDKLTWLVSNLSALSSKGQILIFAGTKDACEQLAQALSIATGIECAVMHGDKTQDHRLDVMKKLKKGIVRVVVATDVAARGLDVQGMRTVVNYEIARSVDAHVHRIGRVGREGQDGQGIAYTLISTDMDPKLARVLPGLIQNLEAANQSVPEAMRQIARRLAPREMASLRSGYSRHGIGSGTSSSTKPFSSFTMRPASHQSMLSQTFSKASAGIPSTSARHDTSYLGQKFSKSQSPINTDGKLTELPKKRSRWDS